MKIKISTMEKIVDRVDQGTTLLIGICVGFDMHFLYKTHHLRAPTWACVGFNISTILWKMTLKKSRQLIKEQGYIIEKQQGLLGELFKIIDQTDAWTKPRIDRANPDRN